MEKRVFLAIFLSFIVLAVYQSYFAPPPPVEVAPSPGGPATGSPAAPPAASPAGPPAEVEAAGPPAAAPIVADAEARDIVVDTASVRAIFSTRGAVLKHWQLKQYLQTGEPLDLVPEGLPDNPPAPFTIATPDPAQSAVLARALYQPSANGLTLDAGPGTLTFQYRDASGLNARKTFYFQPDGHTYQVNVEVAVDVNGVALPVAIHWGPGVGLGIPPEGMGMTPPRAVIHQDGDVERYTADDLAEQSRFEGTFRFAGVEDHYFLSAALPRDVPMRVEYRALAAPDAAGEPRTFIAYAISPTSAGSPGGAAALPFYMGPKNFDALRAVDSQLVRAIDFGMFAWLVVPLLQALKWINGYVHNYGWSIIILTILINLAIFPLRHRSMVSMRKMQALQPEIKAIQERYAKYKITDPERQKMNQEMMALYKQKGVNPASGCVPMLLTMPVLFAFYAMLSVAIELRGAPFLGWIDDLAAADPLYITPVLMGATMLWQQRMMPTTADPVQQRIFLLMPLIFTVMFLAAPAGLVIYWLFSNLMAIGQQYFTNRVIGPPPGAKPKPAVVKGRPGAARARS